MLSQTQTRLIVSDDRAYLSDIIKKAFALQHPELALPKTHAWGEFVTQPNKISFSIDKKIEDNVVEGVASDIATEDETNDPELDFDQEMYDFKFSMSQIAPKLAGAFNMVVKTENAIQALKDTRVDVYNGLSKEIINALRESGEWDRFKDFIRRKNQVKTARRRAKQEQRLVALSTGLDQEILAKKRKLRQIESQIQEKTKKADDKKTKK